MPLVQFSTNFIFYEAFHGQNFVGFFQVFQAISPFFSKLFSQFCKLILIFKFFQSFLTYFENKVSKIPSKDPYVLGLKIRFWMKPWISLFLLYGLL